MKLNVTHGRAERGPKLAPLFVTLPLKLLQSLLQLPARPRVSLTGFQLFHALVMPNAQTAPVHEKLRVFVAHRLSARVQCFPNCNDGLLRVDCFQHALTFWSSHSGQRSVTSGNRCIALRKSSVERWVYCLEIAVLSCPTISRASTSDTPAAFSIVTALCRRE